MQVKVSQRARHSISAALDVARHSGEKRRKAREIADCTDIPTRYLPQILATLVRAGLLDAEAGPTGGYTLARNASQISLLDLVEASDGPLGSGTRLFSNSSCEPTAVLALEAAWSDALRYMSESLQGQTLASLLESKKPAVSRRS